jgi:methanogenic corrinoid protein MtbC1
MTEMGVVSKALEEGKLWSSVKVLIGGAAVSDEFGQEIGAAAIGLIPSRQSECSRVTNRQTEV